MNDTGTSDHDLPAILAGPILRRLTRERFRAWLVTSRELTLELELTPQDEATHRRVLGDDDYRKIPLGRHAWLYLIDAAVDAPLPQDTLIAYDLQVVEQNAPDSLGQGAARWAPHLCYDGQSAPRFVLASSHRRLLHGSCRRPHYDGPDGLAHLDSWLAGQLDHPEAMPAWLLMTGDQVYADDVAGPMLVAIHALIKRLGLFDEVLEGAVINDSPALYASPASYYRREELLPDVKSTDDLKDRFFGGVRKPVFTSASAANHLMTFAEMMAMYLLVWSPTPWRIIELTCPELDDEHRERYQEQARVIDDFVETLPAAARVMAHLPSLMIFDDHDVTDDWNLTAQWEQSAYGHPFSKRIIGNALMAYLLCQGWGNDPDRLKTPLDDAQALLEDARQRQGWLSAADQDASLERLFRFEGWEFQVEGTPRLVVLDTRTRRWRNGRKPHRPSGLMDWEALSEFQQELIDAPSVVIVSPAPMFGVKLIEAIQKLFTLAGKPLMVDAENWMAHRGAASVMLNIFRHSRTPGHYVILSGDVHYSFVYDIRIRHRRQGPKIWQVTSSGIKNCFPDTLLDTFDRLNRWLYSPRSPLNWFTQRRPMAVEPRDPDHAKAGERLWNGPGIGLITLAEDGSPDDIRQLDARGMEVIFPPPGKAP
ncbi:alkaline phosphatase D family protein [Halomonas denitrificans]|uniref:alkaline phosphatase D family protein n=1 Tax=Halomonas denitrificans TaxID=370769 RepID=UPI001C9949B5|nr:alkaline phosphatase D family protein [Halomonas denitrificans]MBY5967181.1 alkaline phosphatase family protein [Halomonas denitrificans]